ncbi:hypothetical protein DIPPA_27814 [Diplonema papillatum]|nr:hypothetical protein DIPPA_27814 [Diplonema papillatum]
MYATEWRDLSRADRRQAFLPCPICGTRSLAPLLHLFVGCDAPAAVLSRLTIDADLDAKSRLRAKPPPADAMERLWAILFVFPELALAYLQRCGTLPSYGILAGQASAEPVGGGVIAPSRLTPPPRAPPTRTTRSLAEGAHHLLARCGLYRSDAPDANSSRRFRRRHLAPTVDLQLLPPNVSVNACFDTRPPRPKGEKRA